MPKLWKAPLNALKVGISAAMLKTMPPKVREVVQKYGSKKIISLQVSRTEVIPAIKKALDLLSGGKLSQEMDNLNYDKLWHLFFVITLEGGHKFRFERNQVVNLTSNVGQIGETMDVPITKDITLAKFIENGERIQGRAYWIYDPVSNNCQSFLIANLRANGMLNDELRKFIQQKSETLLQPWLQTVAKGITDVANVAEHVMQGSGRKQHCRF